VKNAGNFNLVHVRGSAVGGRGAGQLPEVPLLLQRASPRIGPMKRLLWVILSRSLGFAVAFCAAHEVTAADLTAFELVKEGNRYVGEHVRDHVVEIRSDKSIGGLTPTIWYIVYYDSTAALKAAEVKFGAGKMLDVKRPMRLIEPITGGDAPLDRQRLKVDSDKVIQIVKKEPLLEKLTLKALRLNLARGELALPTWKVRVWAQKLGRPDKDVDIGEMHISAADGKVVKLDLHIDRVD